MIMTWIAAKNHGMVVSSTTTTIHVRVIAIWCRRQWWWWCVHTDVRCWWRNKQQIRYIHVIYRWKEKRTVFTSSQVLNVAIVSISGVGAGRYAGPMLNGLSSIVATLIVKFNTVCLCANVARRSTFLWHIRRGETFIARCGCRCASCQKTATAITSGVAYTLWITQICTHTFDMRMRM